MYLQQAFPANHLALQERKTAKTTKETSGRRRSNVFAMFDPDTHSWKTSQVCLILDTSAKSSLRWPKQGLMQDGVCSEQTMWVHRTVEKDSGYWPTPNTLDSLPPKSPEALLREATVTRPGRRQPANLRDAVSNMKFWPTPVQEAEQKTGQLHPNWVESYLMGWPIGWTDLKLLEMDKFQQWLQQHGKH